MKIIIKLFLGLIVTFSPFLSFAYQSIPGCTSPAGMSTLTGESCATTVMGPVLKVVSPDTAESLERGSTYVIKWTSDQSITPGGLVSINFVDEVSGTSNLIANVKSIDGFMNSYSWKIPANIPLGKYRIFVFYSGFDANQCKAGQPECFYDKSNLPFNIIEMKPPLGTSIALLSPNGGEQITAGTFLKIHWKQESQYHMWPTAQVFLVGVSGPWAGSKKLVADYVERFPDDRGASVYIDPSTPSGSYHIRIEDVDSSSIFDESDAPITVISGAKTTQFSLITPNGGETWQNGGTYKLKWKVVPSKEKIKSISISFFDENLTQYFYSQVGIATSTNSGVMDFTLPTGFSELQPGKYKIAIGFNCAGWFAEYDAMKKGCALFGVSMKPFTITAADASTKSSQPTPTLKVDTAPQNVPEQTTTTVTLPETVTTVSAQAVAEPIQPPKQTKIGFWKSISCFLSGLFGGVCK